MGATALVVAVALNVGLTVAEIAVGWWSGSLALVADAVHNLGDAAALVVALVAYRIARRGADARYTFGYERAELIGALINLTSLLLMGAFLVFEALERFLEPQPVATTPVMVMAAVAVIIDLGTAFVLWGLSKGSLNLRAAFLHNLTDAASSVAVILGAALIAATGWVAVDPLLTLLIAGGVLWSSFGMLKETAHILMEGTPKGLDLDGLRTALEAVPGVMKVHHVHAWQLGEAHRAVEAHVVLEEAIQGPKLEEARCALRERLKHDFGVEHATLEMEWPSSACGDHADLICHGPAERLRSDVPGPGPDHLPTAPTPV